MNTSRNSKRKKSQSLLSTLFLVLAVLSPSVTPGHVIAGSPVDDVSADLSRVLPPWWPAMTSPSMGLPGARPRAQEGVHHFDVAVPASGTAGVPFSTVIEARAADNSLVGVTTTVSLETNPGEPIAPSSTAMFSGTAMQDIALTAAGVGKLIRAISGTITGEATITIYPADAYRVELSPADATVTAGDAQSFVATAYDQYDNERGDVTPATTFDIDDAAGGGWSGSEYTSERAGTWTVAGTYEGVTGTAALTVEPAGLDHIIINSEPDNGGAAFGNPVEVGTHTMQIYQTTSLWAGCYDQFDNFCGDVAAKWGATGVLAQGALVPSTGISTTFTPAPILSGTGVITAAYVAGDQVDSTGLFTIQAPKLIISKSGSPNPVAADGYLLYIIDYANVGSAVAQEVRITETYDSHVNFISAGPQPDIPPNVWTLATLDPGQGSRIYVTVQVDDSMAPGTLVTNVVTVGGSRLAQYSFTETTVVTSTPDLTLTLEDSPDPVKAGDNLGYRIEYRNQGTAPVHNARITMTYDSHVTFVSSEPPPDPGTDNVWTVGDLAGGEAGVINITVAVDELMLIEHTLVTSATIKSDETDPFTAYETTSVEVPPSSMQLSISNDRDSVEAGDNLFYTLSYMNAGGGNAYNTTIIVTPPSSQHVRIDGCWPSPICQWKDGQLLYDIGTVPDSGGGAVFFMGRVHYPLPAGARIITASAVISTIPPSEPPEGSYASDVDEIATHPDVFVDPAYESMMPWPGKRVTYTVEYGNREPIATTGVVLMATRPRYTTFDKSASDPCWVRDGGRRYTCEVGELGYGERGAPLFVVVLPSTLFTPEMKNFDASFEIHDDGGSGPDANPDDNVVDAHLGVPNLVIEDVRVNQSGKLTVFVKNVGSGWACNLHYSELGCVGMPVDLFIDPETKPLSYPFDDRVTCSNYVGSIRPGETQTTLISFTTVPRDQWPPGGLGFCEAQPIEKIWAKVDNVETDTDRFPVEFGAVAEYDEYDNVGGPVTPPCFDSLLCLYLPIGLHNYDH